MAVAVRLAATVVTVATSIAFTACGAARVGAPVPRPFPSPSSPTTAPPSEARSAPVAPSSGGADFVRYLAMLEELETGGNCFARPVAGSAMGCYQMTRAALRGCQTQERRRRLAGQRMEHRLRRGVPEEPPRAGHRRFCAIRRTTGCSWNPASRDLRRQDGRRRHPRSGRPGGRRAPAGRDRPDSLRPLRTAGELHLAGSRCAERQSASASRERRPAHARRPRAAHTGRESRSQARVAGCRA